MKIDYRAYCTDNGIEVKNIRNNIWLIVKCPFCRSSSGKYHGAVNISSGAYHCWKCGKHSRDDFVATTANIINDKREIFNYLKKYATDYIDYVVPEPQDSKLGLDSIKIKINSSPKGLSYPGGNEFTPKSKKYLSSRGFNPDYLIDKYHLKIGSMYSSEWAKRIIIPIIKDNKVISWQGRTYVNNKLRYRAASLKESLNIKHEIYNIDNCNRDTVIVVEGIFDCWKIGNDCCALFGISVVDEQIKKLADRFDKIYFLFDPEQKAQDMAKMCCRKLATYGKKAYIIDMSDSDSEDPGDMTKEEVLELKQTVFGKSYKVDLEQFDV